MTLTIIISITTCILLILSIIKFPTIKFKKIQFESFWFIAVVGALLILLTRCVPIDYLIEAFTSDSAINPVKIIILLLSLSMLSITLDELGFFKFIASRAVKIVKHSQYKLFLILFFMVAILTVFTSNDIVILTFTLFICYLSKNTKINPIPYLVMEFVTANTCSMFLIIGNPTNIYIATAFNIDFVEYFKVMFFPTLVATLTMLGILLLIFRKKLSVPIELDNVEEAKLKNIPLSIISLVHLLACTIMLAISNYINIDMWLITIIFALSLSIILLIYKIFNKENNYISHVYMRLPYTLGVFVLSMFVIILALDYHKVTSIFSHTLDNFTSNETISAFTYGITSSLCDNILNNIPMSLLYTSILSGSSSISSICIYSTIIGSNIGAFLTPIGALAGMMWIHILKEQKIKFSFMDFTKYGFELAVPILCTTLITLIIII